MGPAFSILILASVAGLAAAQGAVVFGTAWLAARIFRWTSSVAKLGAVAASYVLWAGFPMFAYFQIGGDGGLMDGFGMILAVAAIGFVGSVGFAILWVVMSAKKARSHD